MKNDLEQAVALLSSGEYTCVLCRNGDTRFGTGHGVRPLLGWLHEGADLHGFCAADRVVGRAAAFLYVLLGVSAVHALVLSDGAAALLSRRGIETTGDLCVPEIHSRDGRGLCPMERAVAGLSDASEAYEAIRRTAAAMQAGNAPQ